MSPSRFRLAAAFLAILIVGGCNPRAGASSSSAPSPSSGPIATTAAPNVHGKAVAGPTCPVEPASPLPGECAPRVVAGAVLVFTDAAGHEVARVTTAADGLFTLTLPAGSYTLTPQPVTGLLGVAPPISVSVPATGSAPDVILQYDTGIR